MEHKIFNLTGFKALDEEHGIFEAIVAAFGNVDRGGDKILPGAFKASLERWKTKRRPIPVIFAHEWDNLDAHIGQVVEAKEVDEGLYVKGQLEMDEPFAKRVWKKMAQGVLAEFSFAYDAVKEAIVDGVRELREVELLEVGPCLVGMNPETRLIELKKAIPSHSTATSDASWDGPANEARAKSGETEAYYRRIYAWKDPDGDSTVKASYRFVHHEVDGDGNPGAANVRACQTGIGVLNGGRGGTTIPDEDRQGVWNHLARHLRDADVEPPELKAFAVEGKTGARHTTKEFEMIQNVHDLAVSLGAKCAHEDSDVEDEDHDSDEAGNGKARDRRASVTGLRRDMDLDLLEL